MRKPINNYASKSLSKKEENPEGKSARQATLR